MSKYTWYICASVNQNGMIIYDVILTDEDGYIITYFVKETLRESFILIKQLSEEGRIGHSDRDIYVEISPDGKTLKTVSSTGFVSNKKRILFKEDVKEL